MADTDSWANMIGQKIPLTGLLSGKNVTVAPTISEINGDRLKLTLDEYPGPLTKCFRQRKRRAPRCLSVEVADPPTFESFLEAIDL